MCSIIGGEVNPHFKKNIGEYMKTLSHRGEKQGCGYIVKTGNDLFIYRSMSIDLTIKSIKEIKDGSFIVIHQRKASVGSVGMDNTHPVKGNMEKVRLIHNGTRKVFNEFFNATSDSQGLASFLELLPLNEHKQILEDLGVVFYTYRGKGLYFYKDELRPLVRLKNSSLFASEPLFSGEWASIKDQPTPVKINDINSMPTDKYRKVTYPTKMDSYYCQSCKKVHLRTTSFVCGVCEAMGKKKPTTTTTTYGTSTNTGNGRNKNRHKFTLTIKDSLIVTREVLVNPVYGNLIVGKHYTAEVKYYKQITENTYSLFVNVLIGSISSALEVDIDKFAKLNKLGNYAKDTMTAKEKKHNKFLCLKCSGIAVRSGMYRNCKKCKTYTMCHN